MFEDRRDAGRQLGRVMRARGGDWLTVVGVARGGVVVAAEVAAELGAALDACVVRAVVAAIQPHTAIGAVADGPATYLDRERIAALGLSTMEVVRLVERAEDEVRRERHLLHGAAADLRGRDVILVDDGAVTCARLCAAARSVWARGARTLALAVPVAPRCVLDALRDEVDRVACLAFVAASPAIRSFYRRLPDVSAAEVVASLAATRPCAFDPLGLATLS